jgi:hypothetical protein
MGYGGDSILSARIHFVLRLSVRDSGLGRDGFVDPGRSFVLGDLEDKGLARKSVQWLLVSSLAILVVSVWVLLVLLLRGFGSRHHVLGFVSIGHGPEGCFVDDSIVYDLFLDRFLVSIST